MKNFIYILFILILNSCVTSNQLTSDIIIEKESIVESDTSFIDSSFVDSSFVEPIIKEVIIKENPDESQIVVNEKQNPPKVEVDKKENSKTKDKIKVEVVDNTTLDDITNESVGIMAYSTPEQMVVGKSYTIKLRISKEKNKIQLVSGDRNIPINDINTNSKVVIESIRVEPIMSANLISEDGKFIIKSASTETQNIEEKGYTEWEWRITPLKSGQNFLKLVVKVRIINENGDFYKDITVFDKNVEVKSNVVFSVKTWLSNYWQWLITTIIIPFIIWFYKKKSEEKKKIKRS
jgi:hypothetical protein